MREFVASLIRRIGFVIIKSTHVDATFLLN